MPAGRKGKAKPAAAAFPVDMEEEDEKEFSCGEEADSPRGRSRATLFLPWSMSTCTASQVFTLIKSISKEGGSERVHAEKFMVLVLFKLATLHALPLPPPLLLQTYRDIFNSYFLCF